MIYLCREKACRHTGFQPTISAIWVGICELQSRTLWLFSRCISVWWLCVPVSAGPQRKMGVVCMFLNVKLKSWTSTTESSSLSMDTEWELKVALTSGAQNAYRMGLIPRCMRPFRTRFVCWEACNLEQHFQGLVAVSRRREQSKSRVQTLQALKLSTVHTEQCTCIYGHSLTPQQLLCTLSK